MLAPKLEGKTRRDVLNKIASTKRRIERKVIDEDEEELCNYLMTDQPNPPFLSLVSLLALFVRQ